MTRRFLRRILDSNLASRSIARSVAGPIIACAVLALSACGGAQTGGAVTPSPSPTPVPPAGGQLTATGDIQLVPTVAPSAVTCSFPSLDGPEILLFVQNAGQSMGGYITLSATQVFVRIGAGSGKTYTQRNFAGTGVTHFDATRGASFSAQLTDSSPPGQARGTIGAITSITGSVSCGTKQPGGGNITITGTSTGGAISGTLTSLLVKCTPSTSFALINALTHIGGAPATVEIGGGGQEIYFASFSTSSSGVFFSSSKPGLYTLTNGDVHWNGAVLTQSGAGAAGHTITISGDATCGS
jgi:hypothetical protein